jgi:peptidoglycan-associated lipoprotein
MDRAEQSAGSRLRDARLNITFAAAPFIRVHPRLEFFLFPAWVQSAAFDRRPPDQVPAAFAGRYIMSIPMRGSAAPRLRKNATILCHSTAPSAKEMRMIRLTILCAATALLLSACASDTADRGGANSGSGGAGGSSGGYPGGGAGRGAPGSEEDFVQSAGDRIFFDTDQSVVTDEGRSTLERQVQWLRQNPRIGIWVAGNCDERGTEEYNLALGQRRANADRDYLASRGIDPSRIQTISYGKSRPIDTSSTPQAWAQNRNAITSIR